MTPGIDITGLLRPFRWRLAGAAAAGLVGGAATAGLLAAVTHLLQQPDTMSLALLCGLALAALGGSMSADMMANRIGLSMVAELRRAFARLILAAPLAELERFRPFRLIPILTSDIAVLSELASVLPPLAVASVVIVGCLICLAVLSLLLCALTCVVLGLGLSIQFRVRLDGVRLYGRARDAEDDLQRQFRAIVEGGKELRLHRGRRLRLLSDGFDAAVEQIRTMQTAAMFRLIAGRTLGTGLLVLLIVLVLGMVALRLAPKETASGFVLVLLFMKGPLDQLLNHLPTAGRAFVASQRLRHAATELGALAGDTDHRPPAPAAFNDLALLGVVYEPPGSGFRLGPVDFSLRRGETVFIVGENGAGKTTLLKVLLGLYRPAAGMLLWNGAPVADDDRDSYRQSFACVLSDHFLFDGPADDTQERAEALLDRLGLGGKVALEDGHWSRTDLSTGQRKRLALVDAWMQDRPVMVFDEWAADQDLVFRRLFYADILPELKREGRTLVVISHDDRFFHHADRIVRLDDGRITPFEAAGRTS
ncbi:cyclic peptide export ABC transporter [Azorhizobium caulinodans]|uniref:cyclic peptide export ABC transporter n=1 Tax=Azorhizobium caulinodans TaxID=7 RepID=UPI002FBD321C